MKHSGLYASMKPELNNAPRRRGQIGTIMIVTMWVIFALAGLALVLARTVRLELTGSANYVTAVKVETAASGVLRWLLEEFAGTDGVNLQQPFADQAPWLIGDVFVWVIPEGNDQDTEPGVFAVRDEGGRINVNLAPAEVLARLPGATADLVAAIIAWRGDGDEQTAEIDQYSLLADPYQRKLGPFETIEELLLLQGFSIELLAGPAWSRDPYNELITFPRGAAGQLRTSLAEADAKGWFDYVTVYSRPPEQRRRQQQDGRERVNVNQADSRTLRALLQPVVTADQLSETVRHLRQNQPFANLLDFYYHTGLSAAGFEPLLERIAFGTNGLNDAGWLNINTAPRHVLLCLPGIGPSEADNLIAQRRSLESNSDHVLWVAEVLPPEIAVPLGNLITARSFMFSAEIVAIDRDQRIFRRYRTVVDAGSTPPRVLYWKDRSYLGLPANWPDW